MRFPSVVRITYVMVGICVMAAGLSCPPRTVELAAPAPQSQGELVIFLTGSELGSLRPCGCSGGQLGGLEKRSAVFNSVPASRRLVVETGSLVPSDREQDLMKFRILFEAFGRLNYDVVHLTGRDVEIAGRLGLLADPNLPVPVLRAGPEGQSAALTRRVVVGGRDITVNVVASDDLSDIPHYPNGPVVNIVLLNKGLSGLPSMVGKQVAGVHCIICPSTSDEPQVLSKPGDMPLVCTVGRYGRYIGRLGVTFEPKTDRPIVHFESIPVQAKLPDDPALVQLYRQYQQLVSQSGLLESYPRVPLPAGLAFAGSMSCKRCHESAYDRWNTTAHAHALAALKKAGSDRDPECVICHVIGMEYEGGFTAEEKTPHLAGVGCENCHGPGSQHILTSGQAATAQPKAACTNCHTPEQSSGFAGHEEEYMKKIAHWKERATTGNVKK